MAGKKTPILMVVVALAVSGCTALPGGGGGEQQNQVSITSDNGLSLNFRSLSSQYLTGDQVVLQLGVENTGQATATNVKADLTGASWLTDEAVSESGPLSQAGQNGASLEGVDKATGTAGQSTSITWSIDTSKINFGLPQGASDNFRAISEVHYNYETNARASFTAKPRRDIQGQGTSVKTTNTAGPVRAEIDMTTPVTGGTITVPVTITEVGPGNVADATGSTRNAQVKLSTARIVGGHSLSCQGKSYSLFDGQRRVICSVNLGDVTSTTDFTIRLTLSYPYYVTDQASFTMVGTAGTQDGGTNQGGQPPAPPS
ncbi:MAG: hypothetical protein SVQ76_01560 [Candidatus Nanohaloarchaea archaeon]|nr:hypothetical protein [Candidatus Nanohaloarchaea archaeon]